MKKEVIEKRNELYTALANKYSGTAAVFGPRSEMKYMNNEETTICFFYPNKHQICGMQVQADESIKIWFNDHTEWENMTKANVLRWAANGHGQGSGKGFYLRTVYECVNETEEFLKTFYPERLNSH